MVLRALYCFTAGFMVKEQGSPLDGLISCGAYQVDRLMVGGKWLIENTQHCAVMNSQLMEKHRLLAKKIRNQAFV